MINVIASISVKEGRISDFLIILKALLPKVRKERGCLEYFPALDVDAGLSSQILNKNVVTIIEKWENLETLREHLTATHMQIYREQVKDIVEDVSLRILQEA